VATGTIVAASWHWIYGDEDLAEDDPVIIQWYPDLDDGVGRYVIELPWC